MSKQDVTRRLEVLVSLLGIAVEANLHELVDLASANIHQLIRIRESVAAGDAA